MLGLTTLFAEVSSPKFSIDARMPPLGAIGRGKSCLIDGIPAVGIFLIESIKSKSWLKDRDRVFHFER